MYKGRGLSFIEGGIIGPLILYVVKRDQSEFVAFHALQSLYFGLAFLAVVFLTCGVGVIAVVAYIIWEVIATVQASNGRWYKPGPYTHLTLPTNLPLPPSGRGLYANKTKSESIATTLR